MHDGLVIITMFHVKHQLLLKCHMIAKKLIKFHMIHLILALIYIIWY